VAGPPKIQKPGLAQASPPSDLDASIKAQREKEELEDETKSLEEDLEELKARYDMYFLGVERREPVRERTEIRRRVLKVKEAFTRNTGLKFRIQTLHARYLSYERMWVRSAREKEDGTYRRDLFKARLRARKDEGAPQQEQAEPASRPPFSPAPARTKPVPGAPLATSPPPVTGPMSDAQLRRLYDLYIAAKKSCNEDVSRVTYDAVASTVSKQIPEIMSRYNAKSVEFKVEVKDGRAVLKAVPKV
jgi:hypothetical protein